MTDAGRNTGSADSTDAACLPPGAAVLGARLHSELDDIPESASARLRAMRRVAIAELPDRSRSTGDRAVNRNSWWVAGGLAGSAASVALAVSLLLPAPPQGIAPLPDLAVEEMETLQSMEVLEELEFLAWMQTGGNEIQHGTDAEVHRAASG